MKKIFQSFYGKLSAVFLILLLIMGLLQIWITLQSSLRFMEEADQKLNLPLAKNMALELRPFIQDSLDMAQLEDKIHYMMVMNPKIEIYLLDNEGKILAFFADPRKKVQKQSVDLVPIKQFLGGNRNSLILGDDPRHPGRTKPFSAAPLQIGRDIPGYLYIILGGEQYDSATNMVRDSYIAQATIKALLIALVFTGIIGLILFAFLTRRLREMTNTVRDFEAGDLQKRIPQNSNDEIGQLAGSFNKMADTLAANMEELKRTDNLRRELVANVSHDLRSPLASIQGYLETILIKDKTLSPEERLKYLEIIFNNTTMLNKLVEELFELSKLDARQIQPKKEPFSIAELAQDVVMKFKPTAEKVNIHLQAELNQNIPLIYADIRLIERVFTNLIENAIQYTPAKGTVKVQVLKQNNFVRTMVSDTGYGIPESDLPHIFDRFYRVEKSRARSAGGTGLGLAIAQKILEIHNSNIEVDSKMNAGTTFYFDLPSEISSRIES